jgi:LPS export ABC transporter protein LptC
MLLRILTVMALAALAIGTWILSNQSRTQRASQVPQNTAMPGYYLKGTVMTDYNLAGAPSVKIAAERIEQIDQSTDVELHNVRLDYQTDAGQMWVMVGDKAHVEQDGKIVEVSGNVQMQGLDQGRQGPAVVTTDRIAYDVNTAEVHTDSEVHISFGEHTLTGRGLVAHLKERTMRLESKVYGRFTP